MKTYTPEELKSIFEKHHKWLRDEDGGERADLRSANLRSADLRSADLSSADLSYADLRYAEHLGEAKNLTFPIACPEKGAFTAFKVCRDGLIVELLIPADAKRSSATGRKCRCDKAIVVGITDQQGMPVDTDAVSQYDADFIYRKGDTVSVENFDDNRWNECAPGIHFFITRQEAIDYGK